VWIGAPGLPFAAVLLLLPAPLPVRERAASLLYFYPWALGIALIHGAKICRKLQGPGRSSDVTPGTSPP
jgi:hypothetical protein